MINLTKLIEEDLSNYYIDYDKDVETRQMVHQISKDLARKILLALRNKK